MKYMSILVAILVSACSAQNVGTTNSLDAELDFQAHQQYLETVYDLDNYDPEYVDECFYYEELVCEFE